MFTGTHLLMLVMRSTKWSRKLSVAKSNSDDHDFVLPVLRIEESKKQVQAKDISDEAVIGLVRACDEARCNGDETWGWHGGRPGYQRPPEHEAALGKQPKEPTGHWANRFDICKALGNPPEKVVLAKLRSLIKRGLLAGCACGCRGDFELP